VRTYGGKEKRHCFLGVAEGKGKRELKREKVKKVGCRKKGFQLKVSCFSIR